MARPIGVDLSTPPSMFGPIAQGLNAAGIACAECRIAMEKPIGHDLASSRDVNAQVGDAFAEDRSEEHTSELQSLMRISYAVFCMKKKQRRYNHTNCTDQNDQQQQSQNHKHQRHKP